MNGSLTRTLSFGFLALALTGCGKDATTSVQFAEDQYFESLCEMVQASDAVAEGVVLSTNRGRIIGEVEPHAALQLREVNLKVTSVLAGSVPTPAITLEEVGWDGEGNPVNPHDIPASKPGDLGVFFVVVKADQTEQTYYRVVNSQGYYASVAGGLVGLDETDPLIQSIEALTLPELISRANDCQQQ